MEAAPICTEGNSLFTIDRRSYDGLIAVSRGTPKFSFSWTCKCLSVHHNLFATMNGNSYCAFIPLSVLANRTLAAGLTLSRANLT